MEDIAQLIKEDQLPSDLHPYEEVTVQPVAGADGWYLALCDREPRWWGTFRCLEVREGKIARYATKSGPLIPEQSIYSVRSYPLAQLSGPVIEVIGTTHAGNGNLYLYELRNGHLQFLLKTFIRGSHSAPNLIQGGQFDIAWQDVDGDGWSDLVLTGTVSLFPIGSERDRLPEETVPYRKVFLWDAQEGRFIEDASSRQGSEAFPGRT